MKKSEKEKISEIFSTSNTDIGEMGDLCTDYMKIFGANVNLQRYFPSVEDGLKPGERRIIFAMYNDLKLNYNTRLTKVSQIVGETLTYHPHGESPVADTIAKLGQPWNNIQCLIKKKGNWGSPMGDPVSAARYIEGTLSKYTYKCFFEEFNEDVVDMEPNYLFSKLEPTTLPSKYPHILIAGAFGIGYGMATGIPMYNFREVCELAINLIKDPNYPDVTLIPDQPTGAMVIDEGQFTNISETGQGKYRARGNIDLLENGLKITSTPYLTSWNNIKAKILELNNNGGLGIKSINDFSNEDGIEIILNLKPEFDPQTVRDIIYKKTDMERVYSVDFNLVDNLKLVKYNIRTILYRWFHVRRTQMRRILNNKIIKFREREHILDIILFVVTGKNAEKTLDIIRKSADKETAIQAIMKLHGITSLQAYTIAGLKMEAFNISSIKKMTKEKEFASEEANRLEKIVRKDKKIDAEIIKELEEGIELFEKGRRSNIIVDKTEKFITSHIVVLSRDGYIKKLPERVNTLGSFINDDLPMNIINANNDEEILVFDNKGKVYSIPLEKIPSTELISVGEHISKYINIKGTIVSVINKPIFEKIDEKKNKYFLFITKNGIAKRTNINEYSNIKSELTALSLKKKDELVDVVLCNSKQSVVIYTDTGRAVRLSSKNISETSRVSMGIRAIDILNHEVVIGMDKITSKHKSILIITTKGYCKTIELDLFGDMKRFSSPIKIITLKEKDNIALIKVIQGNEISRVYFKNTSYIELDTHKIKPSPKLHTGDKIIPVRKGDHIAGIIIK